MWTLLGCVAGGLAILEEDPAREEVGALLLELGPEDALQPALDALGARGGTLSLRPGRYPGPLLLEAFGPPVEVRSASGARNVILEGSGGEPGPVLTVRADRLTEIALSGLIFQGGQAERGGGLALLGGSVMLTGSAVRDNEALEGGGIYVASAELVLEDVEIEANAAERGGGLHALDATVALGGVQVARNEADLGGGLFAVQAALASDEQTRLEDNAAAQGGGLYLLRSSLWGGSITGNQAERGGGASLEHALLDRVVLERNHAAEGGGLHLQASDEPTRAIGLQFLGNMADERGGGLLISGAELTLVRSAFSGNRASAGGGAAVGEGGTLGGEGVLFEGNESSDVATRAGTFDFEGEVSFFCTDQGC